jgi:Icc-related predicted phosphoesterase
LPFAGPSVVITHHAPHPMSLPDGFDLAHCYASDPSRLIQYRQPDLGIHGHLHGRLDYRIGATRIVCNATRAGTSTRRRRER